MAKTIKSRVHIETTKEGLYKPYFVVNGEKEYPFENRVFLHKKDVREALKRAYETWNYKNGWITIAI